MQLMGDVSVGRFLRIVLVLLFVGVTYVVLKSRSGVLLPFLVAWLVAYLLYPIVKFFQYRLRFKYRLLSIVTVLVLLLAIVVGFFILVIPSIVDELSQLKDIVIGFVTNQAKNPTIPSVVIDSIREYANEHGVANILQSSGVQEMFKSIAHKTWFFAVDTINVVLQVFAWCITLLYLFFILLDYERLAEEWLTLIPVKWRAGVTAIVHDLTDGMNQYFRGQALIALLVGVMLSIGFLIIDFPMAVGFGLFIGLLNLVPYLQLVSLLPMTLLALIDAVNTGGNFWITISTALAVVLIVQAIQDFILVPHIMGRRMKLHPAVILLSLAVWGKLLGIVGMIMALPLTTLIIGYVKHYHQLVDAERNENEPKSFEKEE